MKRRSVYFLLTLFCFLICFLIVKLFSNFSFIRGFIGDVVIIILIYSLIKSIANIKSLNLAIGTLALAYFTEFIQYLKIINYFGFENNTAAKIIFGSVFDLKDLLAYTIGSMLAYIIDNLVIRILNNKEINKF